MLELSTHMHSPSGAIPIDHKKIQEQFEQLAGKGFRIIALAIRQIPTAKNALDHLEGMTFLGMVAMIDPVRSEAKEAIKKCRTGGIEVAMLTGDHPATALAIATGIASKSGCYRANDKGSAKNK
jgi:Ca2+-transporting ATPase